MALVPRDLSISISAEDNHSVVGHETSITLLISNNSKTDPIYNISFTLDLPDGISFISSSAIPSTNVIDKNYHNIVTFTNINDLYPQETNYKVLLTFKIDETFRSSNKEVPYDYTFSNIRISVSGDSRPRGSFDEENTTISSKTTTTMISTRYMFRPIYSSKQLKGAGTSSETSDATSRFPITLQLINTTRDLSDVSLDINLANGIRYLDTWSASGTDSANFSNPIISDVNGDKNYVDISLQNKTLSPGSITSVTFQAAIWDKYTINGTENSGSLILNDTKLYSSAYLTGNETGYKDEFVITALDLELVQSVENMITDVSLLNEYTLNYSTSAYFTSKNALLYFIIPDGMSYVDGSSTLPPDSITSVDNDTLLEWKVESLEGNTDEFIKLYTVTDDSYEDGSPVYSTDTFTSYFNADYIPDGSTEVTTFETSKTLLSAAPVISTNVLGYYYNDLSQKKIDVAAVGDYVKLEIIYDASSLAANQKDVVLYDYPPLNIDTSGVRNIETSGDVPDELSYEIIPSNGAMIPAGTLKGGTFFSITFDLPVTGESEDSNIYNLAKVMLNNTDNLSYSTRDSAAVFYGSPYLQINSFVTQDKCLALGDTFTYNIEISNTDNNEDTHVADGFNIDFNSFIPSIYDIISDPVVNTNSDATDITVDDNSLSLTINNIPPEGYLNISLDLQVNSTPIMKEEYTIQSSITNGTSQQSKDSYEYTSNKYKLSSDITKLGCQPTIRKEFKPSTVTLNESYHAIVTINYPEGIIAYNNKIKDSLVTSSEENLRNVTLDGEETQYTSITNNITVPIADVIDTTNGEVSFVLEYDDSIPYMNIENYSTTRTTPVSIDWAVENFVPESLSEGTRARLTIVIPGIDMDLYHSNITKELSYDKNPINGSVNDNIIYRATLTNVGKSTAYDITYEDYIPENLTYVSDNMDGSYDRANKGYSAKIGQLEPNESVDILLNTTINNDSPYLIAENSSSSSYIANEGSKPMTSKSNTLLLYNTDNMIEFEKYQRNLTIDNEFTQSTINCYYDQSIQYKLIISNTQSTAIEDISITDMFPKNFSLISYEPFTKGDVSIDGNTVNIKITDLEPSETAEFIYTIKLTQETLQTLSSTASLAYSFEDSPNTLSLRSNTLYVKLAGLGKGFLSY